MVSVLTVPMRNGNSFRTIQYRINAWFLPYLWGMETILQWTCCNNDNRVLTVPMRNGNSDFRSSSMWGQQGSYRTYEEWKLLRELVSYEVRCVLTVPMRNGNFFLFLQVWWRSGAFLPYLWGMETDNLLWGGIYSIYVLTVPMRNGNGTMLFYHYTNGTVLTVPMRNGNSSLHL